MKRSDREKYDWWNKIPKQERKSIDEGLADIKAGRIKSHEEVKKLYVKWL
jgi:predicted transcriptional regulator